MRSVLAPSALSLLLWGCAGTSQPMAGPLVASIDETTPPSEPRPQARPPLLAVGESFHYQVSLHGVGLADLIIDVTGTTPVAQRQAAMVEARVDTRALASMVAAVHDRYRSWIDLGTGLPIQFEAREAASRDDQVSEETLAEFASGRYPVRLVRGDNAGEQAEQVVQGAPFDFVAFLIYLRGWEPHADAELTVDIMRSRYAWRVRVRHAGDGNLATALGELPVVRFDGEGVRLLRDGSVDPSSDRRRFSIWVSDDADRVPVALVARTDYGDVKLDLVRYQAGR